MTKSTAKKATKIDAQSMMKDAQAQVQQVMEQVTKSFDEVNAFGKANLEALVKASEASAQSAEAIVNQVTEMSQKNFDAAVKATQDLAAVKTVSEFVELQTNFFKSNFETFTAQAQDLSEAVSAGSKEAMAPVSERVQATAELSTALQA